MYKLVPVLLSLLLLPGLARAQEEDDDPKAAPRHAPAKAKVKPAPAPVAAEAAPAKKAVTPATAEAPPKKPAPSSDAPIKRAATPRTVEDAPAPLVSKKSEGRAAALSAPPSAAPVVDGTPSAAGSRPVRVRLTDGSTVVGQVRAEQPDALVIDCALGQLAIPRLRISTIAYDSAAAVSSKRAPVQQLDDGDLPPRRRAPAQP